MNRIIKIGMDVHSTNYTLCAMEPTIGAEDRIFGEIQVAPDYKEVLCFIESLKMKLGFFDDYSIECGYEAGCLGYTLYHQLTGAGIKCVILAPSTMLTQQGQRIKTDRRDARLIAQCLCYGGYHPVYIPTGEDDAVKEYVRMRDDHKLALKKLKQQINAFVLRHGHQYAGTKWTIKHLIWLSKLELHPMYRETLNEYMTSYSRSHMGEMCYIVVITDGRANVPLEEGVNANEEVLKLAEDMAIPQVKWIIIDASAGFIRFDNAERLAQTLGGTYFRLEDLNADRLAESVRAVIR